MMPRAAGALEWLDRVVPAADRDASLCDVERLNTWLGGHALTLRGLADLVPGVPPGQPLRVLDVGGGRGDLAARIVRWAERRGRGVRVILADRIVVGTPGPRSGPEPLRVRADATALPFRENSVDVAVAALTLHHLDPDAASRTLGQMRAVARVGIVVNDLLRTRLSLTLVWLATRVLARHRFSRHDGPLSVRRAYRPEELAALAERAGVRGLAVRRYRLLARVVAVARWA